MSRTSSGTFPWALRLRKEAVEAACGCSTVQRDGATRFRFLPLFALLADGAECFEDQPGVCSFASRDASAEAVDGSAALRIKFSGRLRLRLAPGAGPFQPGEGGGGAAPDLRICDGSRPGPSPAELLSFADTSELRRELRLSGGSVDARRRVFEARSASWAEVEDEGAGVAAWLAGDLLTARLGSAELRFSRSALRLSVSHPGPGPEAFRVETSGGAVRISTGSPALIAAVAPASPEFSVLDLTCRLEGASHIAVALSAPRRRRFVFSGDPREISLEASGDRATLICEEGAARTVVVAEAAAQPPAVFFPRLEVSSDLQARVTFAADGGVAAGVWGITPRVAELAGKPQTPRGDGSVWLPADLPLAFAIPREGGADLARELPAALGPRVAALSEEERAHLLLLLRLDIAGSPGSPGAGRGEAPHLIRAWSSRVRLLAAALGAEPGLLGPLPGLEEAGGRPAGASPPSGEEERRAAAFADLWSGRGRGPGRRRAEPAFCLRKMESAPGASGLSVAARLAWCFWEAGGAEGAEEARLGADRRRRFMLNADLHAIRQRGAAAQAEVLEARAGKRGGKEEEEVVSHSGTITAILRLTLPLPELCRLVPVGAGAYRQIHASPGVSLLEKAVCLLCSAGANPDAWRQWGELVAQAQRGPPATLGVALPWSLAGLALIELLREKAAPRRAVISGDPPCRPGPVRWEEPSWEPAPRAESAPAASFAPPASPGTRAAPPEPFFAPPEPCAASPEVAPAPLADSELSLKTAPPRPGRKRTRPAPAELSQLGSDSQPSPQAHRFAVEIPYELPLLSVAVWVGGSDVVCVDFAFGKEAEPEEVTRVRSEGGFLRFFERGADLLAGPDAELFLSCLGVEVAMGLRFADLRGEALHTRQGHAELLARLPEELKQVVNNVLPMAYAG